MAVVVVEVGETSFLLPFDFFSLPFLTALNRKKQVEELLVLLFSEKKIKENSKYSDDLVVVVARVTDGERRFGRLLDLDLKRYLN